MLLDKLACLNSRRADSHSLANHELLYFRSCLRLLPGFKVIVVPNIVCVVLYKTSGNCSKPVYKSTSLFVIHVVYILSIRLCKTVILVWILFVICSNSTILIPYNHSCPLNRGLVKKNGTIRVAPVVPKVVVPVSSELASSWMLWSSVLVNMSWKTNIVYNSQPTGDEQTGPTTVNYTLTWLKPKTTMIKFKCV